jgi:UDP-N-acetylmuramate dehydrogenase
MNAGAYGGQMSDVVAGSEYLDLSGKRKGLSPEEHRFAYRRSFFMEHPELCYLRTFLKLKPGSVDIISARMQELKDKRTASQPLDMPSAGSVFKRPEGNFAGTLIEKSGLKGVKIGGAQVSQKHAGFIVNCGGATCSDVLRLIEHIQKTVSGLYGVALEPEIRMVGEF